jgi:fatty-acyl-CoA synthase
VTSARSYFHRGGDMPLLGATIPEHFLEIVSRFPDQEAVVSLPQNKRLTYKQLSTAVDELARGLLGCGFSKGDRIGVWSTDNLEWLLLQMATARIGAVLVNINPAYRARELAYALERSEVHGVFAIPAFRSSDYVGMLAELLPELKHSGEGDLVSKALPHLRRVVVYDPADPMNTSRPPAATGVWRMVRGAGRGRKDIERGT